MDAIDQLNLMLDSAGEGNLGMCQLNHGRSDPEAAVNVLTMNIEGLTFCYNICQSCIDGLHNGEWVLFVCLTCSSTAWRIKQLCHREYSTITWLKECPHCSKNNTVQ